MAALDGQTLEQQGPEVWAMFGGNAAAWEAEHNQALQSQGYGQKPPPQGAQVWSGQQNLPPQSNPVQVAPDGQVYYPNTGVTQSPPVAFQAPSAGVVGGTGSNPFPYAEYFNDQAE